MATTATARKLTSPMLLTLRAATLDAAGCVQAANATQAAAMRRLGYSRSGFITISGGHKIRQSWITEAGREAVAANAHR